MVFKGDNGKEYWVEGDVTEYDEKTGIITIGKRGTPGVEFANIKDCPKDQKEKVKIGVWVRLVYKNKSYWAQRVIVDQKGETMKTEKELKELIKVEPFIDQKILDKMSDKDKDRFAMIYMQSLDSATKIFQTCATYDETKQDMGDLASKVIEAALGMCVIADNNTYQILKKNQPEEEKT